MDIVKRVLAEKSNLFALGFAFSTVPSAATQPSLIVQGKTASFLVLIIVTILVLYLGRRAAKGHVPTMRRIVGLDALSEGVARATEAGRPVLWATGAGGGYSILYASESSASVAALSILSELARLAASYDAKLIAACPWVDMLPLVEDTIKTQYAAAGKPEKFTPDTVRYASTGFAYITYILEIIAREVHGGANFFVGPYWHEAIIFGEVSRLNDCFAIGGTGPLVSMYMQIPFMVATMDYVLIGEEFIAADPYITKDPTKLGSVAATDWVKNALVIIATIGALLITAGSDIVLKILTS